MDNLFLFAQLHYQICRCIGTDSCCLYGPKLPYPIRRYLCLLTIKRKYGWHTPWEIRSATYNYDEYNVFCYLLNGLHDLIVLGGLSLSGTGSIWACHAPSHSIYTLILAFLPPLKEKEARENERTISCHHTHLYFFTFQ